MENNMGSNNLIQQQNKSTDKLTTDELWNKLLTWPKAIPVKKK